MIATKNLRQQHLSEKIIYQPRVLPLIDKSCGEKTRFPGWGYGNVVISNNETYEGSGLDSMCDNKIRINNCICNQDSTN